MGGEGQPAHYTHCISKCCRVVGTGPSAEARLAQLSPATPAQQPSQSGPVHQTPPSSQYYIKITVLATPNPKYSIKLVVSSTSSPTMPHVVEKSRGFIEPEPQINYRSRSFSKQEPQILDKVEVLIAPSPKYSVKAMVLATLLGRKCI